MRTGLWLRWLFERGECVNLGVNQLDGNEILCCLALSLISSKREQQCAVKSV